MRHRGTVAAVAMAAALATAPVAAADPVLEPMLGVSPGRGAAPVTVTVIGSCPKVADPDGYFFPTETTLSVAGLGDFSVPLDSFGMFIGFDVDLPADAGPGVVPFTTGCGGETSFEVLPSPALELSPDTAARGADVVVTGTCPGRSRPPTLLLDGRPLGTLTLDSTTGEIGPTTVVVPDDATSGARVVTTSCGGRTTLTVPAPRPTTSVPPGPTLVTVPDLRGLTEAEAVAALGGQLVLANASGAAGTVVGQDPPPGARVRPGTPVRIELTAGAVPPSTEPWPVGLVVAGVSALLVLLAAVIVARAPLRRRREHRWLGEHVAVAPAATYLQVPDAPRGPDTGLEVDLEVRREPARWSTAEVVGGRR